MPGSIVAAHRQQAAGDSEGLVRCAYEAHNAALMRFARRFTYDDDVAADSVHEAYLRLVRVIREGRPPDLVLAWLYRVTRNLLVSESRRRSTAARARTRLYWDEASDGPDVRALERERDSCVKAALSRLQPDARQALYLSASGYSGRETARAIGRSEAATRTMLCRARRQLRRDLESYAGIGLS